MKLILYNLHVEEVFANTVKNYILKNSRSPGGKYAYLFDIFQKEFDEIYFLVDKKNKEHTTLKNLPIRRLYTAKTEIKKWMKINEFKTNVKIITSLENAPNDKDTILFGFGKTLLSIDDLSDLKNFKGTKIFNLSHFFAHTDIMSKKLEQIDADMLISENNLYKNSKFFRKMFPWYKKNVYQLPFVAQNRFKMKKKFSSRINKCLATGTWGIIQNKKDKTKPYIQFYKAKSLHPLRMELALNLDKVENEIDSIMPSLENKKKYDETQKKSRILEMIKKVKNAFVFRQEYFRHDLVKMYNDYKMFVMGEETIQVPAMGYIEGTMCGAVYLGINDPMYTDLGFKPGKHYIGYKDLKDLKKKVNYYQNHPKELEKIQKASYEFVKKNHNSKKVANDLIKAMKKGVKKK